MTGIGANATILSEYLEAIGLLLTPQAEEAQNCFLLLLLSRVAVRALFLLVSLIEMRISTRTFDVGVFTQPGPEGDVQQDELDVRSQGVKRTWAGQVKISA